MASLPLPRFVSSTEEPDSRRPNVLNADNERYQPRVDHDGHVYGDLDELNGDGARETSFKPTRHELIQLVKFWACKDVVLDWQVFMTSAPSWEMDPESWWLASFGERRIKRAADLLGDDVVQRAIAEAHNDFRKGLMTPRQWDMFMNGTAAERSQLHRELDKCWVHLTALEDAKRLQEEERDRWSEQHQAARTAERERRQRRTALEKEVEGLQEQLENLE